MIAIVYGLVASDDPETIRYIGITTQPLEVRLRGHFNDATNPPWNRKDHRKSDWVREVIARGADVKIIKLAEHGNDTDLFECESGLIVKHKPTLLNLSGITSAFRRSAGKRKVCNTVCPKALNIPDSHFGMARP